MVRGFETITLNESNEKFCDFLKTTDHIIAWSLSIGAQNRRFAEFTTKPKHAILF